MKEKTIEMARTFTEELSNFLNTLLCPLNFPDYNDQIAGTTAIDRKIFLIAICRYDNFCHMQNLIAEPIPWDTLMDIEAV